MQALAFCFNQAMYRLQTPIERVVGVGPQRANELSEVGINTVQDLLLWLPLRYEDRSQFVTIAQLQPNQLVTLSARVVTARQSYRGRRSMQTATLTDDTGKLKVMWFNNRFVMDKLKPGSTWLFSGKLNDRGYFIQPTVEAASADTIHTGRLVPIYPSIPTLKSGSLRRILKQTLDHLSTDLEHTAERDPALGLQPLRESFQQLHFPDTDDAIVNARQRLALEELLSLMKRAQKLKTHWKTLPAAHTIPAFQPAAEKSLITELPFALTGAQKLAWQSIQQDLSQPEAMNRLLIGDVGSGKTVVAGLALAQCVFAGKSAALVAPTQILAEQHLKTFQKLFPRLPLALITGTHKIDTSITTPTIWIGTHAVLRQLEHIQPSLLVFDEQHRFGVQQRSQITDVLGHTPHILTMSATPIPRSLMLTIFAHLSVSTLDELPPGRIPTKTWLVPSTKKTSALEWIRDQIHQGKGECQVLWVCPFIDPSRQTSLENVASATAFFTHLKTELADQADQDADRKIAIGLLHGRQNKKIQTETIEQLRHHQLDIVVTTPIVEVGVDLPAATIMVIEAAERFGLASLHQLRGRVGRAGQQGYCLLFTNSKSQPTLDRLDKFTQITNGSQLAELDLENRGAGDIFGTQQHGFDELQFATWTDFALIAQARDLFEKMYQDPSWESIFDRSVQKDSKLPLAN